MSAKKIILSFLFVIITGEKVISQNNDELSALLTELHNAKDSVKPDVYNKIAFYYGYRDKYDSALYYGNKGLQISEKLADKWRMAKSYNTVGNIYRIYSDYDKAILLFTKAFEIFEKNKYYKEAARAMGSISTVYGDQMQFEKEREKLMLSIEFSKMAKDTEALILSYAGLANNYFIVNKMANAGNCLDTGLILYNTKDKHFFRDATDSAQFAYSGHYLLKTLAQQLYHEKKFDSSIALYQNEMSTISDEEGFWSKEDLLLGISNNYIAINKFDSALYYTDIALDLLKKDSIPQTYMNVYEMRARIYEKRGDYKEAYSAFKKYKELSDSIISNENFKTTTNIQTRYETQKKDLQISKLNEKKKSQKIIIILVVIGIVIALGFLFMTYRAKKLQKGLFGQKEQLLIKQKEIEVNSLQKRMNELEQMALRAQMNPHFIFNSLNSVQHFVMKQDVEGVNKYLGAFAHLIRQTLNNSGKPLVSLDDEVKYLDTYLSLEKMKSNNGFHYHIDVKENIDTAATFIPGMILQPFVENSIRHGVTRKEKNDGLVNISISRNGSLVCLIEDNGIGREKAAIIKSAAGDEEYESKGMAITMNRIDTINKMYDTDISVHLDDIHDAENKPAGTRVKIEFPAGME